jgi:hypothetical protein
MRLPDFHIQDAGISAPPPPTPFLEELGDFTEKTKGEKAVPGGS